MLQLVGIHFRLQTDLTRGCMLQLTLQLVILLLRHNTCSTMSTCRTVYAKLTEPEAGYAM